MPLKQPLKKRIVIAFFLMTLIVAGLSSISIFFIIHALEEHFVSQGLKDNLHEILNSKIVRNEIMQLNRDTKFYTTNAALNHAIPKHLRGVSYGFSETLLRDGSAYYIFKEKIENNDYLIVKDQTDFETREQVLLLVVILGFIGSLIFAYVLGKLLANKILEPVIRLAKQVEQIKSSQNKVAAIALSNQYADDEVGQLASALDSAFNNLKLALDRERFFTSDVSHELRTPLMVIATSCELLCLNKEQLSDKDYKQIERISTANKDMKELVETFLMLARVENSSIIGEKITLSDLALEQASIWRTKFEEKEISFSLIMSNANATILFNKTLLKAVMSNLLRNAWHYTEVGSVKLIVENDSFRVDDTGIGVPKDKQQAIFQAFVRGSSRGEGLGLGLSIVKRICYHQHWQVKVISKQEGGSIFYIKLLEGEINKSTQNSDNNMIG